MILSFESLLLASAVSFFLCLLLLAYRTGSFQIGMWPAAEDSGARESAIRRPLTAIHYLLLLAFVIFSGLAVLQGGRTWISYALEGALFLSLIVQVKLRGRDARTPTLFTLSIVAIVVSSIPLLENHLFIFGPDQSRDYIASVSILSSGNFGVASVISGGYYSFVPSLASLITVLAISGHLPISLTYLVLTATLGLLLIIMMFSVVDRLLNSQIAGIICVALIVSSPQLSTVDLIPQTLSLALASALIMLILVRKSTMTDILAIFLIFVAALTVHPSGVLAYGLVMAALILLRKLADKKLLSGLPKNTVRLAIVLAMIAGLYWAFNGVLLVSLSGPFSALLSSLSSLGIARASVSTYTSPYFAGPSINALAWSLPVAASGAFLIASIARRIKHRTAVSGLSLLLEILAVFGLLAIGATFLSVVADPGAGIERYTGSVGYLLLLLPSAALVSTVIIRGRVAEVTVVVAILFVVAAAGASSPGWSPIEASQFSTVHITYVGYQEAFVLAPMIPSSCYLYSTNDIDFTVPLFLLGKSCGSPTSEQATRPAIIELESGISPSIPASEGYTLFVLSTPATNQTAISGLGVDVPFSSNYHMIVLEYSA